jgi:hypothetical protein
MPDDSTRRLLRIFGIAVTDCEDALSALEAALQGSGAGAAPASPLDAYERAAREAEARWTEVAHLLQGYQARARAALLAGLRARGAA